MAALGFLFLVLTFILGASAGMWVQRITYRHIDRPEVRSLRQEVAHWRSKAIELTEMMNLEAKKQRSLQIEEVSSQVPSSETGDAVDPWGTPPGADPITARNWNDRQGPIVVIGSHNPLQDAPTARNGEHDGNDDDGDTGR